MAAPGRLSHPIFAVPLILGLAAASACGYSSDDILAGTWELTSFSCDGVEYTPPTGISFQVSYDRGSGTAFGAVLEDSGNCRVEFAGNYSRTGLTVTERPTEQECFSGCTISSFSPGFPGISCSGLNSISTTGTYVVNIPETGEMEQSRPDSTTFCPSGAAESQIYSKVN